MYFTNITVSKTIFIIFKEQTQVTGKESFTQLTESAVHEVMLLSLSQLRCGKDHVSLIIA